QPVKGLNWTEFAQRVATTLGVRARLMVAGQLIIGFNPPDTATAPHGEAAFAPEHYDGPQRYVGGKINLNKIIETMAQPLDLVALNRAVDRQVAANRVGYGVSLVIDSTTAGIDSVEYAVAYARSVAQRNEVWVNLLVRGPDEDDDYTPYYFDELGAFSDEEGF